MIRVLLADDQHIFLDGMHAILEKHQDIQIVGHAVDGRAALDILSEEEVDVVVLDIDMKEGMGGIEATKIIKEQYKKTHVLILSMHDNKEYIIKLMNYGAAGYILKNMKSEELLMAIRNVAAGRVHYGLKIMNQAIALNDLGVVEKEPVTLTNTEVVVMKRSAEGLSSQEIADLLGRAKTTIDKHRQNIYNKLDVKNLAQLTRYAIRHDYIKP